MTYKGPKLPRTGLLSQLYLTSLSLSSSYVGLLSLAQMHLVVPAARSIHLSAWKVFSPFTLFKANSSSISQLNRKPILLYALIVPWMLYDMEHITLIVVLNLHYCQINVFMGWDTLQKQGLCLLFLVVTLQCLNNLKHVKS